MKNGKSSTRSIAKALGICVIVLIFASCDMQCRHTEQTPTPAVCGNGILEAGEECDDGNADCNDTCSCNCTVP